MARFIRGAIAPAVAVAVANLGCVAQAQTPDDVLAALDRLQAQVADQAAQMAEQERLLAAQQLTLRRQDEELARLRTVSEEALRTSRGAGYVASPEPTIFAQAGPMAAAPPPPTAPAVVPVVTQVGEPPPEADRVEVEAVPESAGVLTRRGSWTVEPSIDFTHGSSNRLVFRGVEIVTGIQIGVIEASDADRNALAGAASVRYGVTDRLEVELRLPYMYRSDKITTLAQREEQATRTFSLEGQGIGDVELGARYQLTDGGGGWPVFVGGLRIKSDTGRSPFDVKRDADGVALELGTGSGFWGVDTSLTFLYPTDPAVIFGGVSYLAHLPKDINRTVGEVLVGEVDPGDSIGVNAGFGFALNPRFSFSLAYKHNYIFRTESDLGPTRQRSESLQVGAFTLGWSLRLTERITLSNSYEIGTTRDSPDMRMMLRLPVRF